MNMKKKTAKKIKKAMPVKSAEIGDPKRRSDGKFGKGNVANPKGRPKGPSITEAIRAELLKVPEGSKITYLKAITKKILAKVIVEGDSRTIGNLWNHVDGMPSQKIDVEGDAISIVIKKPDNMKEI